MSTRPKAVQFIIRNTVSHKRAESMGSTLIRDRPRSAGRVRSYRLDIIESACAARAQQGLMLLYLWTGYLFLFRNRYRNRDRFPRNFSWERADSNKTNDDFDIDRPSHCVILDGTAVFSFSDNQCDGCTAEEILKCPLDLVV